MSGAAKAAVVLLWLGVTGAAFSAFGPANAAAADQQEAIAKQFDDQIRPFLARHCLACHGTEKPKGNLRLDQLPSDFADKTARQKWQKVQKRVAAGEMPPKSKPRPAEKDVAALSKWIRGQVESAEAAERAAGRVVFRRLNRGEYENTVRDLLGVKTDLKDLLPLDTSADGFDNIGDALHTSSFLMERYLEAADTARRPSTRLIAALTAFASPPRPCKAAASPSLTRSMPA
ncbi:MAG: DUF1587 domain-containing protein [Planctomycetia bacterium]|nr:DUF1587 domain-containing protein [Planctomycetia bacterium]